jgi:tetratricopeptide (TPR) repeat protein
MTGTGDDGQPPAGKSCSLEYATGDVIVSHRAHIRFEAKVTRGRVEVTAMGRNGPKIVRRVVRDGWLNHRTWTRYNFPVELRASEATTLDIRSVAYLLPDGTSMPLPLPSRAKPGDGWSRHQAAPSPVSFATRSRPWIKTVVLLALLFLLLAAAASPRSSPVRPFLSELLYGLASLSLDSGYPQHARSLLHASLALDTNAARAHNDLGTFYYEDGQVAQAEQAFRRAVAIDPSFAVALNNLGFIQLEQEAWQPAAATLQDAVTRNPESAAAWANLGLAEQMCGHRGEAIRAYRAALRLDQANTAALANLGALLYQERQWTEAGEHLVRAVEKEGGLAQAHLLLGAVALVQRDRARAWQEFEVAGAALEDDPNLHFYLGLWYEEVGRWQEMQREMKQVLALRPNRGLAVLARSHLLAIDPTNGKIYPESLEEKKRGE